LIFICIAKTTGQHSEANIPLPDVIVVDFFPLSIAFPVPIEFQVMTGPVATESECYISIKIKYHNKK